MVASGISLHWHGLYMWNNATWSDGTPYLTQCPIAAGTSFTYSFRVDEMPGTYIWHDHASALRADGLQGALIIRPRDPNVDNIWGPTVGDHVLFISDWNADEGNVLAMRLNRPLMAEKITEETGYFMSVPTPASLLVNGAGFVGDCLTSVVTRGANGYLNPICGPQRFNITNPTGTVPRHKAAGCGHKVFEVEPGGKSYFFRLVNAAMATYVTVCFEGHNVTMVTGDAVPTEPKDYPCIDLNMGQR